MSEIKKINGHDLYFISDDGKVFSEKYNKRKELSQRKNSRGYLYVNLCENGKYKSERVHRLVATAFIENPSNLEDVNHIDGNKENNNVNNLEWVSRKDNIKHAFEKGLNKSRKHEKHHGAKLSKEEVAIIRERYKNGENMKQISKDYIVSYSTIKLICHNKLWI